MPAVIVQSVGAGGKNTRIDSQKIEDLLRKAGVPLRLSLEGAIEEFQLLCGLPPDGKVDPGGATLRTLNAVTNPLKLRITDTTQRGKNPPYKSVVSSETVERGGYRISYDTDDGSRRRTEIPPVYRVLLGTSQQSAIDISGRPQRDVLDLKTFVELLKLIERLDAWGTTLTVQLFVDLHGRLTAPPSNKETIRCPVKPHSGTLLSETANQGMPYLGEVGTGFWGRMLVKPEGYDKYVFVWARHLELDTKKRGFDCITYAGAVCGAQHTDMSGRGDDLAEGLNARSEKSYCATPVGTESVTYGKGNLDGASVTDIGKFFEANKTGYFLLYSTGHVTLVADGYVYEFKPKAGFAKASVSDWVGSHKGTWTVKRILRAPPLARA